MPQILLSFFALFWLDFVGMTVAGCATRCDYAAADAAYIGLRIALPVIAALTFAALVFANKRGYKSWPLVVGGVALTILVTCVASQVVERAYLS